MVCACIIIGEGRLTTAQQSITPTDAPCGVVDQIEYPLADLRQTTIDGGFDDFALFRARFGGNHVGIDVGFRQQGAVVRAVARGRVTLSNVNEWTTEKGVVIIEHIFPNGERYYSLYGHMEETNEVSFPRVGDCLNTGDPVGAVGWPSLGAPHLHYEIRDFLPTEGGPGYVTGNPLAEGWSHPLDFTHLWQIRLTPAFRDYVTFQQVPTLPPVVTANGTVITATADLLQGVRPPREVLWRVTADGRVIGLRALPGERVVAHSENGQVVVLTDGRYTALWTVIGVENQPFQVIGEALIFAAPDGSLAAFDAQGVPLWTLPAPASGAASVQEFATSDTTLLHAVTLPDGGGVRVHLVEGSSGTPFYETTYATIPAAAPAPNGGWMLLGDGRLDHVLAGDGAVRLSASVNVALGRTAQLSTDVTANSYLYVGDADHTLLSWDANGSLRWRIRYPAAADPLLPPLLRVDLGCVVYLLDVEGRLSLFSAATGELLNQVQLYTGGSQSRRLSTRLLAVMPDNRVDVGAGFLTMLTLDGAALAGEALGRCLLG